MPTIEEEINLACENFFSEGSTASSRQKLFDDLTPNVNEMSPDLLKKYIAMKIFCFAENSINKSVFDLTHGFRRLIGQSIRAETHRKYTLERTNGKPALEQMEQDKIYIDTSYIDSDAAYYYVIGLNGQREMDRLSLHQRYSFIRLAEEDDSFKQESIYIATDGKYVVIDYWGNRYDGQLEDIDLNDLSTKLNNTQFRIDILKQISKNHNLLSRINIDGLDDKLNDETFINEVLKFTSLRHHTHSRNTEFLRIFHQEEFGHWYTRRKYCEISFNEDFTEITIYTYDMGLGLIMWPGHPGTVENEVTVTYNDLTNPLVLREIFNRIETESHYCHTLGFDLLQATFWLANEYNDTLVLYLLLIPVIPISALLILGELLVIEPIKQNLNKPADSSVEAFITSLSQNSHSFFSSSSSSSSRTNEHVQADSSIVASSS